jgi:hypothetical protein
LSFDEVRSCSDWVAVVWCSKTHAICIVAFSTPAPAQSAPSEESVAQGAVNHAALQEIQTAISKDPRHAVPFAEFSLLCKKFGLNDIEARDTARGFHRAGLAMFLEQGQLPEIKDVLLLQPKRVRELIDHVIAMQVGIFYES